ncbi:unnamed protein product [Medioppia subpectinata]|uniref:BTB domain-containing protein n=1 Tax=Medioppia subpectinata TaxID=1979941 RepID=A0A7R9PTN1_9ACAR|nr:unnamed protein product [Medioppia subpectinata]CAG2100697.1 unnamed protein product [Medioppia subpectinata]
MAGNEVIVVTKDDVVFHMNVNNITQMTELKKLREKDIIKISAGVSHVCALTSAGDVYAWGDNEYYQLGTDTIESTRRPLKLTIKCHNEKIVDIKCGRSHNLVLTDAGYVYAWGSNDNYQLGNDNITNQSKPTKVKACLDGLRVTSLVCGGYHSLAVTDTGSVFGWYGREGDNDFGQLGLGHNEEQVVPIKIRYFKNIKVAKVAAGMYHTIILLDDGRVYTCGDNGHGQLGLGDTDERSKPSKLITINEHGHVVDIASHINSNISAAVTANGVPYVWGECRQPFGDLLTPTVMSFGSICDVFALFDKTHANYRFVSTPVDDEEDDEEEDDAEEDESNDESDDEDDDEHPVLDSLTQAFDNHITSSFQFVIDGHPIHVHREYLIIRCERLTQLLDTNQTERVITDNSYEAFKAFLRYLYTNDVFVAPDIGIQIWIELLGLADTYGETDLKRKCTRLLRNNITFENVAKIYGASVEHRVPALQDICFKYYYFRQRDHKMTANENLGSVKRQQKLVSLDKWPVFYVMNEEFVHNIRSFIIYGETGNEVIVVTKDDVVFHTAVNNITEMTELSELKEKVSGAKHLCGLTLGGDVYVWGDNTQSQLGTGNTDPSPHALKLALDLNNEKIVDIDCGPLHTMALTDAGHVYVWGHNGHGQLGNDNTTDQSIPIKVMGCLDGCRVTSIVCGGAHSLAVTDTGSVGCNEQGQLGLGHENNQSLPVQIQHFNEIKVTKVAAGTNHTIILSNEGTGDKDKRCALFKLNTINHHGPIVDVASQMNGHISAAVTANGVLYVWGECREPVGDLLTPTVIMSFGSIYDVFGLFSKIHSTYRSIPLTIKASHPVLNSMAQAFDNPDNFTFKFVIDGHPIHVHREYLIIQCERLRPLLDTDSAEREISDYSYEAFKAFLRYLYTNDVFVAPDIGVELLGLADTYAETDFKRKCTLLITNGITVENVSLIYGAANKHCVSELQEICFNYLVKHIEEVFKTDTFYDLDTKIHKDFILKMAANEEFGSVERRQQLISLDKWPLFSIMSEEFVQNIHSFIIYGETGNEMIVVTKDDVVFHMNVNNITQMTELSELSAKGVIKIVAGESHVCALTSGSDVYFWTYDEKKEKSESLALLIKIFCLLLKIVDINCGKLYIVLLTDAGHLYAVGGNLKDQLNDGDKQIKFKRVKGCLISCHVTSISCGKKHSLAVTDTGSVGSNKYGQLGLGHESNQLLPAQIQYYNEIKATKVVAGAHHTIILSDDGNVYTCGRNDDGQLGTWDKDNRCSLYKLSTINQHAAVTANRVLYVWGECRQPVGNLLTPTVVTSFGSIYDVFGMFAKTYATYRSISVIVADDHPVLDSLSHAFDDPITGNFKFVIDGHPIHVHKDYLIIRCKSLRPVLDTNQPEIEITEYSYEVFKAFLRYLYTNDVFVAPDIAVELLGLADTYAETDLKTKCTRLICKGITVENVAHIYGASVKYSVSALQDICFNYAVKHFKDVSKTSAFNALDIDIYKDFIRKASLKGAFGH